jgi:hypothetical protein
MLRRSLWAAPAALVLAGTALAKPRAKSRPDEAAPKPPPPSPGLVGAWSLVSAETVHENGASTPAFGDMASGSLIYDRSGQMALQIAGERPAIGGVEAYLEMPPSDRMVFLDSYYAYFGTFEIDEAAHVVVHRVRASLRPNETGVTYRRQYVIEGDRLTLATPPETHAGELLVSRLIFVRTHAPA